MLVALFCSSSAGVPGTVNLVSLAADGTGFGLSAVQGGIIVSTYPTLATPKSHPNNRAGFRAAIRLRGLLPLIALLTTRTAIKLCNIIVAVFFARAHVIIMRGKLTAAIAIRLVSAEYQATQLEDIELIQLVSCCHMATNSFRELPSVAKRSYSD